MKNAILINSTITYNHVGCYLTSLGLRRLLLASNILVSYETAVNEWDLSKVAQMLDSDPGLLVIVNGEGTIHDDQDYACLIIRFCSKYANRVLFLNSQFKNMSSIYVEMAKNFQLIQVRTMKDYQWCLNAGLSNIQYCPDMIFYSGYGVREWEQVELEGELVGGFTDSHVSESSKEIYEIFKRCKGSKWINFHYCPSGIARGNSSLLRLAGFFLPKKYGYRKQNAASYDLFSKTIDLITDSDYIVTGRYHAACLAIMYNKPLIYGYSNTSKVKDLCEDFSYGQELCYSETLGENDVLRLVTHQKNRIEAGSLIYPWNNLLERILKIVS